MFLLRQPYDNVIRSLSEEMVASNSMHEIEQRFLRQIEKLGYSSFVYIRPPNNKDDCRSFLRWSTWPQAMKKDWIDNGRTYRDPTVAFMAQSSRSWFSSEIEERIGDNVDQAEIQAVRRSFAVPDYFCVKVSDGFNGGSYVVIEGDGPQRDEIARSFLWLAAMHLELSVRNFIERRAGANGFGLSLREIQVVCDVDASLSEQDSAGRMALPIEQYREHVRFACEKTGVDCINQAAEALRYDRSRDYDCGEVTPLSDRERRCLDLASYGMTDAQISHHLSISRRTVSVHIASAIRKLGAKNRPHAVRLALQSGVI